MDKEPSSEVVVLGAGFSKAVNSHLPDTNALGKQALTLARRSWPKLVSKSFTTAYPFETWLSLLAQEQPHLQEAENRENAATFAKVSGAIADALQQAQDKAFDEDPPDWLYSFLGVLHHLQSTVLNFNYDTIVEAGVESTYIGRSDSPPGWTMDPWDIDSNPAKKDSFRIRWWDILRGQPPAPPAFYDPRAEFTETFRLLKLHGSINWWHVPSDTSGTTLSRSPSMSMFGSLVHLSDEERRRFLPGRERFLVPPLAIKSTYYSNPMARQLWQDAYTALQGAERIALIGYSLPMTDIVTAGMLNLAMGGRKTSLLT